MNTIVEIVENRLESNEDRTVFTFLEDGEAAESKLSLGEIRSGALKFAGSLEAGARALILLPQGLSFIKAFFGCLYAGAIGVPTALPGKHRGFEKLRNIVEDAGISVGITNRATLANLTKWFGEDFTRLGVEWLLIEEIEENSPACGTPFDLPKAEQIAFLQYTSGSTARPKAVVVTHENIIANSQIIRAFFRNGERSASVCWLPSFHDMGLIDGIIQPIFSGFGAVLMSPTHFLQKPARWLKALTKYRATYSGGPNFAFDLCVDRIGDEELSDLDLHDLHCLYNASEPIRAQTIARFVEKFSPVGFTAEKAFTCYGLAEATLAVTASRLGKAPTVLPVDADHFERKKITPTEIAPRRELVSSGRVYEDTILKIVEPESDRECGEMEIGEICVAGRSVAAGYWNAERATAENFVRLDGARFFKTGDLGFLAAGELFVTGRLKDLIIIRGKNHFPQDIEQTVSASHECLQTNACAAFAVEIEGGEKLVLAQEIKRTCLNRADLTGIFSSILADLSRHHGLVPHEIILLFPASLAKTSSGKIQRSASRALWLDKKLKALAVWSERRIVENVTYENRGGNSFLAAGTNRPRN